MSDGESVLMINDAAIAIDGWATRMDRFRSTTSRTNRNEFKSITKQCVDELVTTAMEQGE